jgi:hypothetical protein
MRPKILIPSILLMLMQSIVCNSQESFNKIFKTAKDKSEEVENLGYKVIHLDLDILNIGEEEETRLSLNSEFKYTIAACGDQNRIRNLQIELWEIIDNRRILLQKGRDGGSPSGSSVITFIPEKNNSYLITIKPVEFFNSATNGRYYLIVASKSIPLELKTTKKEDARLNNRTLKLDLKNLTDCLSTFRINKVEKFIEYEAENSFTIKYEILTIYNSESDNQVVKYQVKDQNGKEYTIEYNAKKKTILILELIGNNNYYSGTLFILN